MSRSTIHLTNASSRKLHHGRVFNIMARPRPFERMDGEVALLAPAVDDLRALRAGGLSIHEYRTRYDALMATRTRYYRLEPGAFTAADQIRGTVGVGDGDTLVCACSKAAAARGECHRVWAARWLHEAGWRVVLDGEEYQPEEPAS